MDNTDLRDKFYLNVLGIKRQLFNPNPEQDKYSKVDRLDCVIRSICKILDKSWESAYIDLSTTSFKNHFTMSDSRSIEIYLSKFKYININDTLDDIETVGEFMYKYKTGKYLISSGSHIAAYIDGIWYDNYVCLIDPYPFIFSEPFHIFVDMNNEIFEDNIKETLDLFSENEENSTIINNLMLKN